MACFRSTTLLVLIVAFFIIAIGTTCSNARKLAKVGVSLGPGIGLDVALNGTLPVGLDEIIAGIRGSGGVGIP